MRKRAILTVGEVKKFIKDIPDDKQVWIAPSVVNEDEPEETDEFILEEEEEVPCVAIEVAQKVWFRYRA